MEEFGVNGAICDAVAKKPWLASLMSFCSLASASPMETSVFQPLCLVQSRGCFPAACSAPQWQNETGSLCPLFSTHLISWFLDSQISYLPFARVCSWLCIYRLGFTVLQVFRAASVLPALRVSWLGGVLTRLGTEGRFKSIAHPFCTGNMRFSCCHGKPGKKSRESHSGEGEEMQRADAAFCTTLRRGG